MNSYVLMLVLTAMTNGATSAAFVETANAGECEMRLGRVLTILNEATKKGSPAVSRSGCFAATTRFQPFEHDTGETSPAHHYLIAIVDGRAEIGRQPDAAACRDAMPTARGERHCVQSRQSITE